MIEGVFKGFLARAKRICSHKFLHDEIEFLIKVFDENGHNAKKLRMIAEDYTKDSDTISEESNADVEGVECVHSLGAYSWPKTSNATQEKRCENSFHRWSKYERHSVQS